MLVLELSQRHLDLLLLLFDRRQLDLLPGLLLSEVEERRAGRALPGRNENIRAVLRSYRLSLYWPIFYLSGIGRYCLRICTNTDIKKKERGIRKRLNNEYCNFAFDIQLLMLTNLFSTFPQLV